MITFSTKAIERANNTPYGLSAGVWTDKGSKIFKIVNQLRAGVVWANTYNKFDIQCSALGVRRLFRAHFARWVTMGAAGYTGSHANAARDCESACRARAPLSIRSTPMSTSTSGQCTDETLISKCRSCGVASVRK
jgi:Aldehyde dehydrogenase family